MATVFSIKGAALAPKAEQSRMETLIITPEIVGAWKVPPCQRPITINTKVQTVVEQIKRDEQIHGVLTLGSIRGYPMLWIVDGQHRIEAFKLSGIPEAIVDVRIVKFDDMNELASEFVRLNEPLVRMRPDDVLRGLESSTPALGKIRESCHFVGYDNVRRNQGNAIVSMSVLIRAWTMARAETPGGGGSRGTSAQMMARNIDPESTSALIGFLRVSAVAWGREPENYRLWGALNLTLCMWLWNKLVIDTDRFGTRRYGVLTETEFKHCLMSVAADADYLAWLLGRQLTERDRGPCYTRLRTLFVRRVATDGRKFLMPQPAWMQH